MSLFDHVADRTVARLEGLSDDEYRWKPAPGAADLGAKRAELVDGRGNPKVTTIAWRLVHVSDAVARHPLNGLLQPGFTPSARERPRSALAGVDHFRRSYDEWRCVIEAVGDPTWLEPLGPAAGPFADSTALAVALHTADELIHHTAEIALLRDLYRHRKGA
ncbi:DinB family protein [Aquihabitans sp. G128]|uniref:DinB family protein n=1 Tax=Aquihabitans sp. G128 TaxID=2849779 RepID=UPI001C2271FD|nr:DinB family protein [Aquihabitans sp. G128]QXC61071.1 DinB family protein [Aquihabitans sp. G128]